jgi:hypothetical protein
MRERDVRHVGPRRSLAEHGRSTSIERVATREGVEPEPVLGEALDLAEHQRERPDARPRQP